MRDGGVVVVADGEPVEALVVDELRVDVPLPAASQIVG